MEANDFVTRLKADSPEKYNCDLNKVTDEYKIILTNIPAKDRGLFGLNVLRTLCWNLEKAPKWRESVDNRSLLTLAIDCVRETRALDKEDRVKTLACIYHIHRHAVRLNKPIPPELILKISFMPFELDSKHLLKEYHKTYWNILTDRLSYIERLKNKANILKVLPKLTEDITKIIQIYNSMQFCSTILTFLVKKLHLLYSENHAKDLSQTYKEIFSTLAEKDDVKLFKGLTERETFDIYMKLNDCLYIIADNSSKVNFKDSVLDGIVHTCIGLVGHSSDLFHCFQTFYLNFFCIVTSEKANVTYVEIIFNSLENSLQTTEKLGYKKAMNGMHPYLSQLLRLYIEWQVTNVQKTKKFNLKIQENCLKLILFFMKTLKDSDQVLKCENCLTKTGLHDALRLSFLIKHFITVCLSQKILLTTLFETLNSIINEQYAILTELNKLGCVNYQKYFRKLQTDIHNSAISLNKAQYYEFSINLFDYYLRNELQCSETDHKNITRALFNKSICELDCKLFEKALIDAFLSLIFSQEDGLKTDKYMSLVMDVKAKELKSRADDDDDEDMDALQLVSVLDACKMAVDGKLYGDLMPFISKVKFSVLLRHEFSMYAKLWPSIAPVGGVWRALAGLGGATGEPWMSGENRTTIVEALYNVLLETPSVVRTIHSPYFTTIVRELLDQFDNMSEQTPNEKVVYAALLCLQCEYDIAAASLKHGWKPAEASVNPDTVSSDRTLLREHAAAARALRAVEVLQHLTPQLHKVSRERLRSALQVYQVLVPLLLQLSRDAPALQLAYICCLVADVVDDHESFVRNAGVVVTSCSPCDVIDDVIARAGDTLRGRGWGEPRLVFLCDVALYYIGQGRTGVAARLLRLVQDKLYDAINNQPQHNLELAVGRLLEAQALVCAGAGSGPSAMTAVNIVQRHYLAVSVTGTKWSSRRLRLLTLRVYTSRASLLACALPAALGLRARARAAAAPMLTSAGAGVQAALYAALIDVASFDDAQIKIDTRLKRILGLRSSTETPDCSPTPKKQPSTPKQEVETMRDIKMFRKNQTSPSLPWVSVPGVKIPEFFKHNAKCNCYACEVPIIPIMSCKTACLEAQIYAYANENEIAKNYFGGFLEMVKMADEKLKQIEGRYREIYEDFIVKSVVRKYRKDFISMRVESLIDLAFFEMKSNNFAAAEGYIVEIHEIVQEIGKIDPYLSNEVVNLMAAAARQKETIKKPDLNSQDFENLSLTPAKDVKTPEKRPSRPPKHDNAKIKVKDEEVPKKRSLPKQIKIDDIDDEDDFEKPVKSNRRTKKDGFKVPNPIIPKPVLEEATPRPFKTVPKLLLTQPSEEDFTPNSKIGNNDFFTPAANTLEQFFTPMTSVKTYSKKSLRQNIVKNLQQEFSTPISVDKENKRTKEVGSTVKEESSTKKEDRSKVKNRFIIKEDESVNELTSTLKNKLTLKEVKSTRKGVSSAVKEDRSVIRELNSNAKGFRSKESTSKVDRSKINDESSSLKEVTSVSKDSSKKVVLKEDISTKDIKEVASVSKDSSKKTTSKEDISTKDRLNVANSSKNRKDNLVRAVSPGKLLAKKERESYTRTRRARQLNLDS